MKTRSRSWREHFEKIRELILLFENKDASLVCPSTCTAYQAVYEFYTVAETWKTKPVDFDTLKAQCDLRRSTKNDTAEEWCDYELDDDILAEFDNDA